MENLQVLLDRFEATERLETGKNAVLHQQHNLPKAFIRFHSQVRFANFFRLINSINYRSNDTVSQQWHNMLGKESGGGCLFFTRTRTKHGPADANTWPGPSPVFTVDRQTWLATTLKTTWQADPLTWTQMFG